MNDAEYIKTRVIKWLLDGNLSFDISRDAIGVEVLFSKNRRSADLLILSQNFHALEIKGYLDDPRKLEGQLDDYHKTFDKVSIVTTPKHISEVNKIIKPYTGFILFDGETFKVRRLAKQRKRLDKYSLLMFLNKSELNGLSKIENSNNLTTDEIRILIAERLSVKEIREAAYSSLKDRYCKLFRLFMKDTGGNIISDELKGLCGRIDDLY
jgi:hypothetical protein